MPEIAEVARIVHFLRLHLVGKTISSVTAVDDGIVFGKVGTSGSAVESALRGKRVVSAGGQGKYFWVTLDKPPHLVMHFGMTGWMHIRGEKTAYTNYYKSMKESDIEQWPPKFCKFHLTTEGNPAVGVAFTDARRLGRVRLVDCPGADIRKHSPLVENGPDPVVDTDVFTQDYLRSKIAVRRVPVKALLLNQTVISGIGNWVADETLYQARIHPEQYCNELGDDEIARLYESIRYVCQTAVDKLGDSDEFPEHWLFKHRWGKRDKGGSAKLPSGEKLAFITVGGRTSCYAPGVQRKTMRAGPATAKTKAVKAEAGDGAGARSQRRRKTGPEVVDSEGEGIDGTPAKKKKARQAKEHVGGEEPQVDLAAGRRRSARLRK